MHRRRVPNTCICMRLPRVNHRRTCTAPIIWEIGYSDVYILHFYADIYSLFVCWFFSIKYPSSINENENKTEKSQNKTNRVIRVTNVLCYTVILQSVHVNCCPRIPRVTFDCGIEKIDLQVYAANFMHHAWPFSSFSRKFPATRAKIPAWSLRVPRKIHASLEALLRGENEIFTQDTWKLDLYRR